MQVIQGRVYECCGGGHYWTEAEAERGGESRVEACAIGGGRLGMRCDMVVAKKRRRLDKGGLSSILSTELTSRSVVETPV
jgi:hypothetical protein